MNDQQMMEFAAKAAGYKYSDLQFANETGLCILDGQHSFQWNPLKSNADALQLAVDLKLIIDCSKPYAGKTLKPHATWWDENMSREELTRCVIVRAAAEIGRELEMAEKHEALRLAEWAGRFCRNVEDPKDILSQKALEQKKPKTRHCDECHHFRGFEINDLKNPVCKLNHRPKFYLPKSTLDPNWGWKKKCKDFQDFRNDR